MTTRISHKVAALSLAAATAFGLSACTPPNQVDSDKKVDTATSQDADSLPSAGQTTATGTATVTAVETETATETATVGAEADNTATEASEPAVEEPAQP